MNKNLVIKYYFSRNEEEKKTIQLDGGSLCVFPFDIYSLLSDSDCCEVCDGYVRFKYKKRQFFNIKYEEGSLTPDITKNSPDYEKHRYFARKKYYKYYSFSLDENLCEDTQAKILSSFHKVIIKSKKTNYAIKVVDNVSSYYSSLASVDLIHFEAKLREFLLIFYIDKFDICWFEGASEILLKEEYSREKMIENIQKIERKGGIEVIENGIKDFYLYMSIMLFVKTDFNGLANIPKSIKKSLEKIREHRNRVFHGRDFFFSQYSELKSSINSVNLFIEDLQQRKYKEEFDKDNLDYEKSKEMFLQYLEERKQSALSDTEGQR